MNTDEHAAFLIYCWSQTEWILCVETKSSYATIRTQGGTAQHRSTYNTYRLYTARSIQLTTHGTKWKNVEAFHAYNQYSRCYCSLGHMYIMQCAWKTNLRWINLNEKTPYRVKNTTPLKPKSTGKSMYFTIVHQLQCNSVGDWTECWCFNG